MVKQRKQPNPETYENEDNSLDGFTRMVNQIDKSNARDTVLFLIDRCSNEEFLKTLLAQAIEKISTFSTESTCILTDVIPHILNSLKRLSNPVPVLFTLLENLTQKKDEVSRLKVMEVLSKFEFGIPNLINMLYKAEAHTVIVDILRTRDDLVDEFVRNAITINNQAAMKNLSEVLPSLDAKYFVHYNSFLFLFESESHYLRNCLLDIFQILVQNFREQENIEAIRELTQYISERLCDVNFYVRSKALGVIGELFRRECILKDQRNSIIKEMIERAKDKTVIVRKKSIGLLAQVLMNHPFKDKSTLERTPAEIAVNDRRMTETQKRIAADFLEFTELMEECLKTVSSLLDHNLKTDLNEISGFIKIAYLLKLNGSKGAIQKMLGIVFTKDKQIIIDTFKEILQHRGEALYEFIEDKAFDVILGHLDIDDKALYKNIFQDQKVFESVYVLRRTGKPLSESNGLALLQLITGILFRSKNEADLKRNIRIYINTLCILKNSRHRIDTNSEIFTLATKNVMKMVFFERSIVKNTVEMIYCTSLNPEITISKFMMNLCLTKSTLKIVDAVGCIALNHFYLLERLERSMKSHKGAPERLSIRNINLDDVREKRKSLEETRRSSLSRMSLDRNLSSFDGGRLSLRFDDLEESLKNKSDEEVADYFFYLKEREILYSKDSMLHQFIPLVLSSVESENPEIQATAHLALFRCMLISSEFFNEHLSVLVRALSNPIDAVKNNALAALHDFTIFYNTSIDPKLLFDKLGDESVNKNALLVIFDLLQKNIIRLKANAVQLVSLLFDQNLGDIVRTLIASFASNNNVISVVFYEAFMSNVDVQAVRYLAQLISPGIQESLFTRCMKQCVDIERLKAVFDSFELSEKFVKENMFDDVMKQIIEQP